MAAGWAATSLRVTASKPSKPDSVARVAAAPAPGRRSARRTRPGAGAARRGRTRRAGRASAAAAAPRPSRWSSPPTTQRSCWARRVLIGGPSCAPPGRPRRWCEAAVAPPNPTPGPASTAPTHAAAAATAAEVPPRADALPSVLHGRRARRRPPPPGHVSEADAPVRLPSSSILPPFSPSLCPSFPDDAPSITSPAATE